MIIILLHLYKKLIKIKMTMVLKEKEEMNFVIQK